MVKEYKRNCPKCGKEIITSYTGFWYGNKHNSKCRSCANKERNKGKPKSEEHKNKLSLSHIGKHPSEETRNKLSISAQRQRLRSYDKEYRKKRSDVITLSMHKPDIRKKHLDAISKTRYLGHSTDIGCPEILEKWNKLGFNFIPNYQIKTNLDLFYLDGYDKEKNVVFEYDSKYHKRPNQKQKDLVRQNKIINILNPNKFWRYDSVDKIFTEIKSNNNCLTER